MPLLPPHTKMIFDAPGSTQNTLTRLFFVTILAAPICGIVSVLLAAGRMLFGSSTPAATPPLAAFGRELLVVLSPVLGQLLAVATVVVLLEVLQGGGFTARGGGWTLLPSSWKWVFGDRAGGNRDHGDEHGKGGDARV